MTRSRGTASRTSEAPRTFNHRRDSGLHSNKPNIPPSVPLCSTALPPRLPSPHGRFLCSAAGCSWDVQLSMLLRAIVQMSWKLDSTSSGPKTCLVSGPWLVLNATLPLSSAPHANRLPNRNSLVSAKLPLLPNQENEVAPWLQERSTSPSHSANCARDQKPVSSRPGPCCCSANPRVKPLLVPGCRAHPKHFPTNAKTQRTWPFEHAC